MRFILFTAVLFACGTPEPAASPSGLAFEALPQAQAAPPALVLNAPEQIYLGQDVILTVSGAGYGEPVYFFLGRDGLGPGDCLHGDPNLCLGISSPKRFIGQATADANGDAVYTRNIPTTAGATGDSVAFQALVYRGFDGVATLFSSAEEVGFVDFLPGCTDPTAANFDPTANFEDDSCDYACPGTVATGMPACPAECTGGCVDATCLIDCTNGSCGQDITCPDGLNCEVSCDATSRCQVADITCPMGGTCSISCGGISSCQVATIVAGDGAFELTCEGISSCGGTYVTCGADTCTTTCAGPSSGPESIACGTSCLCDDSCAN